MSSLDYYNILFYMDKTLLIDLKKRIFLRSALIPVDGLQEIFELNDYFSGDELLAEIFLKGLRDFEFHHPLIWESRMTAEYLDYNGAPDGYGGIRSNFKLYLSGQIDESQIVLVPNAMPQIRLSNSYPYPTSYMLPIDYMRPWIHLGNVVTPQQFYVRGVCGRPLIATYEPDKTFAQDAALYWMNIEDGGVLGQKFIDQVMVVLLEYIRNLKGNLTLPNMGVDVFGAVDVAYQQLKSELDNYYLQSAWKGDLLV